MANILQTLEAEEKARLIEKRSIPDFQPGDTLRVNVRIKEGERERIQAFEGVCIARAGGEAAAMVVIEACVRLIPGVLGQAESLSSESFEDGLLEHPQYTRPRTFEGIDIPEVLLSGDHKRVAAWRQDQRELTTRERRPDLWAAHLAKSQARGGKARGE